MSKYPLYTKGEIASMCENIKKNSCTYDRIIRGFNPNTGCTIAIGGYTYSKLLCKQPLDSFVKIAELILLIYEINVLNQPSEIYYKYIQDIDKLVELYYKFLYCKRH